MADKKPEADQSKDQNQGSRKLLLIIAIVVVVLIGGGVAAFLLLRGDGGGAEAAAKQAAAQDAQAKAVGPMVNIDSFIVNILDTDGTRYLKAALTLELDSETAVNEINLRMPQVKDAILLLVSNKTFAELQDLQGKLQLRAELNARLNALLQTGKIKEIYFTDFVVQ